MKRVALILFALAVCGLLASLVGCASGPAQPDDPYYQTGTIHSDAYPGTYHRAGVGRPWNYRYRRY
jgi:hypothetical protein